MTFQTPARYVLAVALFLALPVETAGADDVTLTLKGDGFALIGELMASDAASFVIKSPKFGVMAVEFL